ncbi:hypothetical protein IP78_11405 [Brevundimonas sp. AAP58]|uniref:hypothetical protein n=1 Tax=Brevundimonas sp. AAP58 TaxID=1523422 RepID=UPI0006B8CDD5|nr:hypothetical protein [Brevundimonas sp. AAP58]KPF78070.1 hypothetical protein IP78_11405 [Brevundimonas sp. AAP58]
MRIVIVSTALLILAACAEQVQAPRDPGVCYAVNRPDGEVQFNVVARDQPQIEFCAARLEEMRLRFLRLGGSTREVTGAFQGQFIFIDARGVSFGRTLEGGRFFALARTGDGRLAMPGAIQRDIDALGIVTEAEPTAFPGAPQG